MAKQNILRNTIVFLSVFLSAGVHHSATAQQQIKNTNGSDFMTEELTQGSAAVSPGSASRAGTGNSASNAAAKSGAAGQQQIKMEDGSLFMEELPDKKKKRQTANPQLDFGSLGVPVDPKGRIIPLIQPGSGPVMSNYSRLEIDYSPRTIYLPYSLQNGPYGYVPSNPFLPYPYNGYQNQLGAFAVPMGIPWSYASSSDDPASQQGSFQSAGQYWNSPWFSGGNGYLNGTGTGPWNGFGYGQGFGAGYGPWSKAGLAPFGAPGASVWSPAWSSPFRNSLYGPYRSSLYMPTITQFQQQGSIRSFFPSNMDLSQ